MQKNVPDHAPDDLIGRYTVPKEDGGTNTYPVVSTPDGIIFFANLGVITFHVPPVRVDDEMHPDWAIWDLDPPPGAVDLVRRAATAMREVLDGYGIPTLLLASGSKGYHLRTPLLPTTDFESVVLVARGAAAIAAAANDDLMTLAFRKADRGDRVFIDWMRNTPRSTSVVPWSLRPRAGAPVAAPISWAELDEVAPDQVRLGNIAERSRKRPWNRARPIDLGPVVGKVEADLASSGIVLEPFDRFRS
jgi:bifunctional non-homologous end joining protein LigD